MASNVQCACNSITGFAQRYEELMRKLLVKQYSIRTIGGYTSRIAATCLHYGKLPEDMNSDEISRYFHHILITRPSTSKTVFEKTRAGLSCYYREMDFPACCASLPSIRKRQTLPVVLSPKEMLSLLRNAADVRSKAVLGMLYSCGLRISELCNLEIRDIDSGRMSVHVRQSKGRKDRYVPLADNMLPVLRKYYKDYRPQTYLFHASNPVVPGKKIQPREVSLILSITCTRIKLLKHITCHTLRHTFASHLLEMGENILIVQHHLGHRYLQSTLKYLQIVSPPKEVKRYFSPLDVLLKKQ